MAVPRIKLSRSDPLTNNNGSIFSPHGSNGSLHSLENGPSNSNNSSSLKGQSVGSPLILPKPPISGGGGPVGSNARLSPQFYLVFFVGLTMTFALLLLMTPPIMTQTTHDQLISHIQTQRKLTTKIAFIADAGLNDASDRVLKLIRDEECDLVLHQGDLDYSGKSNEFYASVDRILGSNFPYFVTMGNYESKRGAGRDVAWFAYNALQRERLRRIPGLSCAVVSSRNIACSYEGVSFVTSAIGVNSSRLGLDLKELRAAQTAIWGDTTDDTGGTAATQYKPTWRFCSWHLPLIDFQVGFREGVPWMSSPKLVDAYEACRQRGAAILTGHEHYYVRSHIIRRFSAIPKAVRYEVVHVEVSARTTTMMVDANSTTSASYSTFPTLNKNGEPELVEMLKVGRGSTFAVVSGLGGHSVSVPSAQRIRENPHLSMIHPQHLVTEQDPNGKIFYPAVTGKVSETTSNRIEREMDPENGYPFGALICVLQKSAVPRAKGFCYFKTISGKIVDRFIMHRF